MKLDGKVKMEQTSKIWEPVKPNKNDNHVRKHKLIQCVKTAREEVWNWSVKLNKSHISVFKMYVYKINYETENF